MQLRFRYDQGNGSEEIIVGPYAMCGFEIANKTKLAKVASEGFGVVDFTELVWRQLQADDRTQATLEGFRKQLLDIELLPSEANPT